jgi:hypothetical protein
MINFTDEYVKTSHPYDLFIKINSELPKENWLEWEPEVFLGQFDSIKLQIVKDKLLAIWGVCGNMDIASKFCFQFSNVVSSFCNYGVYNSVTSNHIEDIFYTYMQLNKLAMLIHSTEFIVSGEVPGYVASCAKYYDWVVLPTPLNFAQDILNHLNTGKEEVPGLIETVNLIDSVDFSNREVAIQALNGIEETFFKSDKISLAAKKVIVQVVGCYLYSPTDTIEEK